MRHPLALLALAALPPTLAAAACSPVTRILPTGSGGSTSATGTGGASTGSHTTSTGTKATSTGTGGSGSGTGGSGTGGGAPMGKCSAKGGVLTVFDPATLAGAALDDKPVVVLDPGTGHAMVHVIVNDKNTGTVYIRSLTSDPTNTVGNFTTWSGPATAPGAFDAVAGWVAPGGGGSLYVQGSGGPNRSIGQLVFPLDSQQGVLPNPSETDYLTPADCLGQNHPGRVFVAQDPTTGSAHYFTSCELGGTPATASTWIGSDGPNSPPVQVGTGMATDPAMNPSAFAYVNGNAFVVYNGQNGVGSGYAFGPDSALGPFTTLPALVTNQLAFFMAPTPTATNDGFVTFAASLATDMSSASFWSGAVPLGSLPDLATSPTKLLTRYFSAADPTALNDVGGFQSPTFDANGIYGAAPTLSSNAANVDWFLPDGQMLVAEQQVYATSQYTVIAAGAASLELPKVVVVWVEHDGSTPPIFQVRAQILNCLKI